MRGDAPFALRIGQHSELLTGLHRSHGLASSAFLTAWNPAHRPTSAAENQTCKVRLQEETVQRGMPLLSGAEATPRLRALR